MKKTILYLVLLFPNLAALDFEAFVDSVTARGVVIKADEDHPNQHAAASLNLAGPGVLRVELFEVARASTTVRGRVGQPGQAVLPGDLGAYEAQIQAAAEANLP